MIGYIHRYKKKLITFFAVFLALIPIVITAFELITTGQDSVVFLADFNPLLVMLVLVYYACLLVFGVFWLVRQIIFIAQIKNEKVKMELIHLQSQVNPHFFFNMLNNLYGLVGTDANKAQELILKLSEMMRYSIYEGEKSKVTLRKEVEYLKNYVELHKMRYHKKIEIDFNSQIEKNHQVIPLLFIILLENAFKHGVENLRQEAFVHIEISSSADEVKLSIENNFDISQAKTETGIGLKNLKRRLELAYPHQHNLSFEIKENIYKAQLTLKCYD
jgi:LytS/YehU family sensor histidine kinase